MIMTQRDALIFKRAIEACNFIIEYASKIPRRGKIFAQDVSARALRIKTMLEGKQEASHNVMVALANMKQAVINWR